MYFLLYNVKKGDEPVQRIPDKNKEIIWRIVDDEAVLLDPQQGKYYGLNPVGCSFWEKVDGVKSTAEIINLLLQEYRVERDVLAKDIEELICALESKSLLKFIS